MKKIFDKPNLIKYKIPAHTEEWFLFRTVGFDEYPGGIGSSEVGKIMGTDEYNPVKQEVFYHKVGVTTPDRIDNVAMFHGRQLEPYVKDIWQCWDGTEDGYIKIFEDWKASGKKGEKLERRALDCDFYLINTEIPQMFSSLDYAIAPGELNLNTGRPLKEECPLEIKTISFWAAQKWKEGLPPKYFDQVTNQMLVTETDYAEIAVLQDGRHFSLMRISKDPERADEILKATELFWFGRVIPARKIYREIMTPNYPAREREQGMAEIQNLEPPPDASKAYQDYIKERYLKTKEFVYGEQFQFDHAAKLKTVSLLKKKLDDLEVTLKNQWLQLMQKEGCGEMRFGSGKGKISVSKDARGSIKLYNSVKGDFEDASNELFVKLKNELS